MRTIGSHVLDRNITIHSIASINATTAEPLIHPRERREADSTIHNTIAAAICITTSIIYMKGEYLRAYYQTTPSHQRSKTHYHCENIIQF